MPTSETGTYEPYLPRTWAARAAKGMPRFQPIATCLPDGLAAPFRES